MQRALGGAAENVTGYWAMIRLAWGQKVSPEFRERVYRLCRSLGWTDEHASWLMACIAFESAETFSPSIRNAAGSGATGLIQFMPRTAKGLGTTVERLAQMSAVQQLDYVQAYFKPYARRVRTLSDMYMAILLPRAVGATEDSVLFDSGVAYRQNAGLDKNKDGKITKAEAAEKVRAKYEKGLGSTYVYVLPASDQVHEQAATQETKTMAPFLAASIPMLIQALPDFAKIFKSPDVAERNVEAAVKATEIILQATGATNVQEAAEMVQSDPVAAQTANAALRMSQADLLDIMERVSNIEEKRISAARDAAATEKPVVGRWKFIHLLSVLFVLVAGAGGFVVLLGDFSPELKASVVTLMLIGGWNAVQSYWLGSSNGSSIKTEMLQK